MAEQMNLAYNTVYQAVRKIRCSILAHSSDANDLMDGEIELDECYFGGRRKGNRVDVALPAKSLCLAS